MPHIKNSFKSYFVCQADSSHDDRIADINPRVDRALDPNTGDATTRFSSSKMAFAKVSEEKETSGREARVDRLLKRSHKEHPLMSEAELRETPTVTAIPVGAMQKCWTD